ncbi:hypothetical protein FQR65_LT17230 [Abscondita terminalis]|nr:hypothetical protein FQR65_LT17230 [Abscondita terminalis]
METAAMQFKSLYGDTIKEMELLALNFAGAQYMRNLDILYIINQTKSGDMRFFTSNPLETKSDLLKSLPDSFSIPFIFAYDVKLFDEDALENMLKPNFNICPIRPRSFPTLSQDPAVDSMLFGIRITTIVNADNVVEEELSDNFRLGN